MTDTTFFGNQLPTAAELWDMLSDILANDLIQSVTGDEETTEAIGRVYEHLDKWPKLVEEIEQMVRDYVYHNRDEDGWPYSQELTDEILDELDTRAANAEPAPMKGTLP